MVKNIWVCPMARLPNGAPHMYNPPVPCERAPFHRYCYWSLARTAERVGEHNFRYPRIRELIIVRGGIALGAGPRTF